MKSSKSKKFLITFPSAFFDIIKKMAVKENKSVSQFIRDAIMRGMI